MPCDLVRFVARPLLSSIFVWGGYHAARNPEPLAGKASALLEPVTGMLGDSPVDVDQVTLVRINAGVQVVVGGLLAVGVAPRASAAVLAASLVPTTLAGHAFWKEQDPAVRSAQQIQFAKNLSVLGGLLAVAGLR